MAHVRDLAEQLRRLGHEVSVMTPVDDPAAALPPYVVSGGGALPVPFNGSVARLAFSPLAAARVRRWLREGHFDVLHVHSPEAPSLSLLACMNARGPIVATFHAANPRSRIMATLKSALQPQMEKIQGRIAVSPAARKTIVEHLGGDAVVIPNGVAVAAFAAAEPLPGWPQPGGVVGFLGRLDEPRKGLPVLLEAFAKLASRRPELRLLVAGPGDAEPLRDLPTRLRKRVVPLGQLDEGDNARFFHSIDIYAAPHRGGESFGIVLLEAMAAGTPIVASDLAAFRRVLAGGRGGRLCRPGDAGALAEALDGLLEDPGARRTLVSSGRSLVRQYDWATVTRQVLDVYETVLAAVPAGVVPESATSSDDARRLAPTRPPA